MIGLQIKKAFFDGWDNFFGLFLCNAAFALIPIGTIFFYTNVTVTSPAGFAVFMAILLVAVLYATGASGLTYNWSCYRREGAGAFFRAIKARFSHAIVLYLACVVFMAVLLYVFPYYWDMGTLLGHTLLMIVFWFCLFSLAAFQYYLPLAMFMEADGPFKSLKKCFVILIDNMGFSMFLLLKTALEAVLSVFLALFVPGICGISLSHMGALKLVLIRYDYMEKHPEIPRKKINARDVFEDEDQAIGPRSLKSMIFPWK